MGALGPSTILASPSSVLPVYVVATYAARVVPDEILARFRMDRGLFTYSLISMFIVAVVSVAASLTASALMQSGVFPRVALTIVATLWLTAPVLSNSFLIFPEPFVLLLTAWTVLVCTGSP